ncbi:MAG: metallopeptidase TldD-related protein, partial [Lentilitoribacter sp.]
MSINLIEKFDIDASKLQSMVSESLSNADDGELFLEYSESESLMFDDGRLKSGSYNTDQGFGLRSVAGEATGYAHSGELSESALKRAIDAVGAVTRGYKGTYSDAPQGTNKKLYSEENPLQSPNFETKVSLLKEMDAYLRNKDDKVRQVSASLSASWQIVNILRADGHIVRDVRPLTRMNISVIVGQGDRQETGTYGIGGRQEFGDFILTESWQKGADEALRQALVNLEAIPAPAGTMDVVLGAGWPGVMLHEAVGHGLEGDFNRKKTSAFADLMGQQVAAKGVTVVDDGTIENRRGSLSVDDEGTPSGYNVLIDDGKLVGYMQDRQNARLMGVKATGNGRRQGYAHQPMPRMTNTYMLGGDKEPEEIITSVKNGIYAVSFGGGQIDITSGKFVFGCTEAYMIEDGKIGAPVKGAMMIGNGPEAMH